MITDKQKDSSIREYVKKHRKHIKNSGKKAKKHLERELYFQFEPQLMKRRELIVRLRGKKRKIFDNGFQSVTVKKIPWKFFPKGKWTTDEIIKTFGKYAHHKEIIDEKRLRNIVDNLEQ